MSQLTMFSKIRGLMEYISVPSALIAMLQITNRYIAEKE